MRIEKKQKLRQLRRWRIRKKVQGTAERPRMAVCFTGKNIYVQFVDDLARKTLAAVAVDPAKRAKTLTEDELSRIATHIEKSYPVEGLLRRQVLQNIQRLKDVNCYRGYRHKRNLPVRGQRTRTNARTRKGPRKTVAGKKKEVTAT